MSNEQFCKLPLLPATCSLLISNFSSQQLIPVANSLNCPMESPKEWTLRQWLAFLLLMAADADGQRAHVELRYLRVELGNEAVDAMLLWMADLSDAEKEAVLQEGLPALVQQQGAREKLQLILRDLFLADGEYGPAEQAMTRRIGDWIRAASI
jgi:uncharacterized tellurite resistance protein B-like protein